MNALIKLTERPLGTDVVQTVNARDLHAFLEAGKDFSNWIKDRINQYGFVENQDFVCSPNLAGKGRGGHNRVDYHLSIDMAKELAMVERNARGKQARMYFIQCEREARARQKPMESMSRLDILKMAMHAEEERLRIEQDKRALETRVAQDAPKVEFHDAVTEAVNCQTVQEVAKALRTGPNRLFEFLRKEGLLMRNNLPYQRFVDEGHFRVVERKRVDERGETHTYTRTLVTGKGMTLIQRRLAKPIDLIPSESR